MGYRTLSALGCILILSAACASNPTRRLENDAVPADRVPPGYSAEDCHYEDVSNQGGFSSASAGIQAASHSSKRIVCAYNNIRHITETQCIDSDGKEKPMEQCRPK